MIKLYVDGRQTGKTTALLNWARSAPEGEHRIVVAHTTERAMQLYRSTFDEDGNPTDMASWQFVGVGELGPGAAVPWGAVQRFHPGQIVLGIDDLDLCLHRMLGHYFPVGVITMTGVVTMELV